MRKIIALCKLVPLLPVVIIAALPLIFWWDFRPWGELSWQVNPSLGQWIVIVLVIYTVVDTVRGMVDDIRHGHVGVDILAVVAILSTLAVREYWASWAVLLMIYSGEAIEEYAHSKAERNLTALLEAAPRIAHVAALPGVGPQNITDPASCRVADDGFREASPMNAATPSAAEQSHFNTVPVEAVKLGDVLVVLPGETVPVDGELLSNSATLDLSNINGEPVPREVFAGARVMSGAINGSATLTMRATELARDSQYQRILELVSSAQNSRAAVVKTADLLAVPFTVISFVIAGVAWFVSGDSMRFAQVLVLATPCPLLIAAPVAYIAGTGRLAKAGVLIKTQEVLEFLGRVNHIFFDKTGTLTVKKPQVVRVDTPSVTLSSSTAVETDMSADEILKLAGIIETYSVHILAKGIATAGIEAAKRIDGDIKLTPVVRDVTEDSGKGVSGEINGHRLRVGRFAYVMEDVSSAVSLDSLKASDVFGALAPDEMGTFVAIDGRLAARIVLKDVPRANAIASLNKLRELGVNELTMVTGDKEASARIIANEVGITDVNAELLPEGKLAIIRNASLEKCEVPWWNRLLSKFTGESLTRTITMMVGDGVNDAPVLAAADIGMAITDGTSTAASESAQVVIMNDDISCVPKAIAISRRTKRVMLQAVCLGLGLALVCMVAAAFNLIPVVIGAFMQEAIDVASILWALTALLDKE